MPRDAIHPGEHLAGELRELGMSAAELSRPINVPVNRMTQIMRGERAVTADTALRLGHWFGTGPQVWMNLQPLYDLRLTDQEIGPEVKMLPKRGEEVLGISTNTAIASVAKSSNRDWLNKLRVVAGKEGKTEVVIAIDQRLAHLREDDLRTAVGPRKANLSLVERVWEAVRVLEEFSTHDKGRRTPAGRTRQMIQRWGEKGAVERVVSQQDRSSGLDRLAKFGRLDCAYEQIIIDFEGEFDSALIVKAKSNLARLNQDSLPPPRTAPPRSSRAP